LTHFEVEADGAADGAAEATGATVAEAAGTAADSTGTAETTGSADTTADAVSAASELLSEAAQPKAARIKQPKNTLFMIYYLHAYSSKLIGTIIIPLKKNLYYIFIHCRVQ
jgi:hypothetical protein